MVYNSSKSHDFGALMSLKRDPVLWQVLFLAFVV